MKLDYQRIVITGAAGGIGRALTGALARRGARLGLLVRRPESGGLADEAGADTLVLTCDVTDAEDRQAALQAVNDRWGGADVLINLAGVMDFSRYHSQDPEEVARMVAVNLEAPMLMTRTFLPAMVERGAGHVVNVGSMFGSIGFPGFAAYAATKFGLRGFSQALRRELADTGVRVTHVSPRAVNTAFNPAVVQEMAAAGIMHVDPPERVARAIVKALEKGRKEVYLGFPESLFARINGLLPGVIDRGLARQTPTINAYAAARERVPGGEPGRVMPVEDRRG